MSLAMIDPKSALPNNEERPDGTKRTGIEYFKPASKDDDSPHGFIALVRNRTIRSHFHSVDQFQILLGAEGSVFQREAVPELMVHYADAYATYGPLIGTDPPLRFFTLRPVSSAGTWYMPESRDELPYRGKRQFRVTPDAYPADELLAHGAVRTTVAFEDPTDGLQALIITAGPEAVIAIPSTDGTSGQYVLVANGTMAFEGREFEKESLGWQERDQPATECIAGASGCRIVVARFPSPPTTVGKI